MDKNVHVDVVKLYRLLIDLQQEFSEYSKHFSLALTKLRDPSLLSLLNEDQEKIQESKVAKVL